MHHYAIWLATYIFKLHVNKHGFEVRVGSTYAWRRVCINYKYCALARLPTDDRAAILTTTAHVRLHSVNKLAPKRQGCPQPATVLQRQIDGDGFIAMR